MDERKAIDQACETQVQELFHKYFESSTGGGDLAEGAARFKNGLDLLRSVHQRAIASL